MKRDQDCPYCAALSSTLCKNTDCLYAMRYPLELPYQQAKVAYIFCEHFKGKVQAGAGTGKASANFNGPTTHAMFGWSHNAHTQSRIPLNETIKLTRLRLFYEKTDVFIIDEVNAMSAAELGLLDETMCKLFDPEGKLKQADGTQKPFGGKRVVLVGDSAQLKPISGVAIYDTGIGANISESTSKTCNRFYSNIYRSRTARGQAVYRNYMSKNCIWLQRSFRNKGLLEEIFDRVRDGDQTKEDLDKLMYQKI